MLKPGPRAYKGAYGPFKRLTTGVLQGDTKIIRLQEGDLLQSKHTTYRAHVVVEACSSMLKVSPEHDVEISGASLGRFLGPGTSGKSWTFVDRGKASTFVR